MSLHIAKLNATYSIAVGATQRLSRESIST